MSTVPSARERPCQVLMSNNTSLRTVKGIIAPTSTAQSTYPYVFQAFLPNSIYSLLLKQHYTVHLCTIRSYMCHKKIRKRWSKNSLTVCLTSWFFRQFHFLVLCCKKCFSLLSRYQISPNLNAIKIKALRNFVR